MLGCHGCLISSNRRVAPHPDLFKREVRKLREVSVSGLLYFSPYFAGGRFGGSLPVALNDPIALRISSFCAARLVLSDCTFARSVFSCSFSAWSLFTWLLSSEIC